MSSNPNPADPQANPEFDPTAADVPDTIRQAFYDEMEQRSRQFGKDLLTLIPELEGLLIIPSWKKEFDDKLFHGIVMGRGGEGLRPPTETMHMAAQMHKAHNHVLSQSFQFLQWLDKELADKIAELHKVREELGDGNRQATTSERDAQGGAPPEGARPSED